MQQFELSEELVSRIEGLIKADNKEDVAKLVEPLHPADIAEIMNELDTKEAQFLFLLLDEEKAGDVLAEIEEDERQRFIDSFPPEVIAKRFVDNMDTDDAADLVGSMPNEQQQEVLSHMEDLEQAGDIVDLLHYDEDSAGGLMGKELVKVNENWTVLTCLRELSRQAENLDEIFYIYVVDDDNILKGRLSLKKMILSPTSTKIQSIYNPDVTYVTTDEPAESVGRIMQKYDLVAIPVVDSIGRLVGRITIDDVVDVIREEAEKDYQMMSGISQDVETSDNVFTQTAARLPWLLIGMIGGLGNSVILGGFESSFATNPKMALFIPLIGGTGGNVGIQSSAIVVQGLANNTLKEGNIVPQILKESVVSLINASMAGYVFARKNFKGKELLYMLFVAFMFITVSLSLFAVVMFASIFGTLVPMTLDKMKIDPALATGPFITITNDIIGMMIYMFITSALA